MRGCTHSKTFSRAQGITPFHKRSFLGDSKSKTA
jgi:hypothetical protein